MIEGSLEPKKFDPIYWKHAIWKGISGSTLVALGSAPTIILGWDAMSYSERTVACIGIIMAVIKSLDMFFDQTLARLAAGKLPVKLEGHNGQDTTYVTKSGITLQ